MEFIAASKIQDHVRKSARNRKLTQTVGKRADYILYAIRDYQSNVNLKGYPIELIPIDFVYLKGPKHGFNILAIKDENILNDKQFRIRKNVSPKLLKHRDPKIHSPRKK